MAYALVIHGGAGARPGSDYTKQKQHMQQLIKTGQDMLVGGKSALDVVVWVVEALEESGLYVAGKGSAPHSLGGFELDASIMSGLNRSAGAVAAIEGIKSPIQAAKAVLDDGRHVMIAGTGARLFAQAAGITEIDNPMSIIQIMYHTVQQNPSIMEPLVLLRLIFMVHWLRAPRPVEHLTN